MCAHRFYGCDVLEVFAKSDTNLVPVLDDKNNYLGYYELEDVIRFLQETPFLKEEGGTIILKKEVESVFYESSGANCRKQ